MDPVVLGALITGACVLIAAVIGVSRWRRPPPGDASDPSDIRVYLPPSANKSRAPDPEQLTLLDGQRHDAAASRSSQASPKDLSPEFLNLPLRGASSRYSALSGAELEAQVSADLKIRSKAGDRIRWRTNILGDDQ
jgi:hypothetical protein